MDKGSYAVVVATQQEDEHAKSLAAQWDWNGFLRTARYNHRLGENKYGSVYDASILAANWVTCACGSQCAIIPRDDEGTPEDRVLLILGIEFCDAVVTMEEFEHQSEDRFEEARAQAISVLSEIETRSAYLIKEINDGKLG